MKPRPSQASNRQDNLFQSRLEQQLNPQHPLFRLARQIDWGYFEREFGPLYAEEVGRPGVPTRLLVGLHYLKHTYHESDESVVEKWVENPYWQYLRRLRSLPASVALPPDEHGQVAAALAS